MAFKTLCSIAALLSAAVTCQAVEFGNAANIIWYMFNGSALTGTMAVQNIAPQKDIKIVYANKAQQWGNTCDAHYNYGPAEGSLYEMWSFNCPINSAGISQFYVEYKVDGKTYYNHNDDGKNFQV